MINGDRLSVRHLPTGEIGSMIPAPDGGAVLTLHITGTTYDVPVDALPYLGRGLDPSLFNRALLERLETGGKLAVKISFRGQRPALPGVNVRRWGTTARPASLTAKLGQGVRRRALPAVRVSARDWRLQRGRPVRGRRQRRAGGSTGQRARSGRSSRCTP